MTVRIDQGVLGLSGIGLAPSGPTGEAFFSVITAYSLSF